MRIALCQINPTVGDVDGNADLVVEWTRRAIEQHAPDLVVFPELVLAGYPAEDLLLKPHFVARCEAALRRIAPELGVPTLVGLPWRDGALLRNVAAYVEAGEIRATYAKRELPNYAVFDEHRWFAAGSESVVVEVPTSDGGRCSVGLSVCEDAWKSVRAEGNLVVNLSASPWRMGREGDRDRVVADLARESGTWLVLCNQVGGQDELVFDGHSVAAAPDGTIVARGPAFEETILLVDTGADVHECPPREAHTEADVWSALTLGLRDYIRKNGFASVLLGLSGGIDSALVLALAVDAIGADRVHAVTMPSRFSSEGTRGDAWAQAETLGVSFDEVPIEPVVTAFEGALAPLFGDAPRDVTEENLQARVRGTLLMALSNKHGHLVLATGNKSEYSVGYATLYGDMNGGFAPLKDVPKTLVFRLARWRNEQAAAAGERAPIPPSVIERPPSAELAEGQVDSNSLPDYDTLDAVLAILIDEDRGVEDAVAAGFGEDVVAKVQRMLDRAEYKRRQAPPGVRVTSKAFGRDRRVPITNRFDGRSGDASFLAVDDVLRGSDHALKA